MLGFVAAVGAYVTTGQIIPIRCSSWCIRHNWTNHSWHFLMKEKKLEQQKVIAETLNGRLAMLGLVAAATSDLLTGHMFFGIF